MILNKELEEMLKVYIDNNLQELKTKFPTIVNYNMRKKEGTIMELNMVTPSNIIFDIF